MQRVNELDWRPPVNSKAMGVLPENWSIKFQTHRKIKWYTDGPRPRPRQAVAVYDTTKRVEGWDPTVGLHYRFYRRDLNFGH